MTITNYIKLLSVTLLVSCGSTPPLVTPNNIIPPDTIEVTAVTDAAVVAQGHNDNVRVGAELTKKTLTDVKNEVGGIKTAALDIHVGGTVAGSQLSKSLVDGVSSIEDELGRSITRVDKIIVDQKATGISLLDLTEELSNVREKIGASNHALKQYQQAIIDLNHSSSDLQKRLDASEKSSIKYRTQVRILGVVVIVMCFIGASIGIYTYLRIKSRIATLGLIG